MDARDVGELLGRFIGIGLVVALVVWFILLLMRRPTRTGDAQARWATAIQVCSTDPRYRLGQIGSVQFHPQRGTSAWVTWYGTGQQQSAWFEQAYPPVGAWVVVTGATGTGVPQADPNTFYVERIHDLIT